MRTIKTYVFDGYLGCVTRRRNRRTGHLYGVYHAEQAGIDPCVSERDPQGLPWVTVCEDHHLIVNHPTLALAMEHLAADDWCEQCAAENETR